jgi:PAS domain S-box-containing protein
MKNGTRSSTSTRWSQAEAEATLRAIRDGAVDAFVVQEPEGHRVYTLEGADLPYSALVERMQQGAAMLNEQGDVIYCNPSLAKLLDMPREAVVGRPLEGLVDAKDRSRFRRLMGETLSGSSEGKMSLCGAQGRVIAANFSFRLLSQNKSAVGVLITDLTGPKHLADVASRLQSLQDEERRRISRELHDSVGQMIIAIKLNMAKVGAEVHKLSPEAAKGFHDNAGMVDEINKEIRTISYLLHPPLLDEVGLPSALRWYIDGFAQRSKINATLEIPKALVRLPQEMEIAIFRAVQECLTNIHRHSGSTSCTVKLTQEGEQLRVEISDSGRGIPPAKQLTLPASGGVGLRGMQERLRQLGGSLEVASSERGTVVTAALPIPRAQAASEGEQVA